MKELLKKLIDAGKAEAFESLDSLKRAAAELGYAEEQVDEALRNFSGFPIDDDDLEKIAGGYPRPYNHYPSPEQRPQRKN